MTVDEGQKIIKVCVGLRSGVKINKKENKKVTLCSENSEKTSYTYFTYTRRPKHSRRTKVKCFDLLVEKQVNKSCQPQNNF